MYNNDNNNRNLIVRVITSNTIFFRVKYLNKPPATVVLRIL